MMFIQKLQYLFIAMITLALLFLSHNYYQAYRFKVPLIVSDKLPSNLYGMALLESEGQIKIFINKKRIRESLESILDDVIAHEYAHALMFHYDRKEGHSKAWQDVCLVLGGNRCNRFVNHQDVIYEKISF